MLDRLLPLDDSSLWFAVDVGLKATLLLAIAAATTVVLRAGSAAVRHRVWTITFAALLFLPLANGILPGWNWRVIPRDWQRANGASSVSRTPSGGVSGTVRFCSAESKIGESPRRRINGGPSGRVPFCSADCANGDGPRPTGDRGVHFDCRTDRLRWHSAIAVIANVVVAHLARRRFGGAVAVDNRFHRQSAAQAARAAIGRCGLARIARRLEQPLRLAA